MSNGRADTVPTSWTAVVLYCDIWPYCHCRWT